MESYKYLSGPNDKGQPTEHWALRQNAQERQQYDVWMANPGVGEKRKPMYRVEELYEGIMIRRYVERPE